MGRRNVMTKQVSTKWRTVEAELINVELPAKTEYLVIARSVTSNICKRMGFAEQAQDDVITAVAEAYINASKHAYPNNGKQIKRVSIRYLLYEEKLAVVVKDFGRGFDPCFVQLYTRRGDAERPDRVGLGIFLIKTLMDEVEYDSSPSTGTQVRMTKFR